QTTQNNQTFPLWKDKTKKLIVTHPFYFFTATKIRFFPPQDFGMIHHKYKNKMGLNLIIGKGEEAV
ncbi:hypothetical protein, partial [Parabacteroides johnsonii]|uniref:hypothetical protein n=1 Tax=Parabacteroides johnsonii TaxID=387661 RepID=UPI001C9E436E